MDFFQGQKLEIPLLRACCENFSFFVENYFLSDDQFRRRSMLTLASIVAVYKGKSAAVATLNFGLKNARTDDDLVTVLQFVRDAELSIPGEIF